MSRNFVQAGRRYTFTNGASARKAGDLVYVDGLFGVLQDDVAANAKGTLILEGVWDLKNIYGGPFVPGRVAWAAPSSIATSLLLYLPATGMASVPSGAQPVGRVFGATVAASAATAVARIQLFNPNGYVTQLPVA